MASDFSFNSFSNNSAISLNTLILVHNREIMKNWVEDLQKFLLIDEKLPTYTTPTGRVSFFCRAVEVQRKET